MEHTKEPWRYDSQPGFCSELVGADGILIGAFVDDPTKADARRIVACVNACAGIPTEELLVDNVEFGRMLKERARLTKQRDDLVVAVKQATPYINGSTHGGGKALRILDMALIKAEEGK